MPALLFRLALPGSEGRWPNAAVRRRWWRALRWSFWTACLAALYTLAGYPLLVAVIARLRPRPWRQAPICPGVSLIVAAHREAEWIAMKLENVLALDYPPDCLEVLVAVDGAEDETAEIVHRYAAKGIQLVYQAERRGKAAALNRAAGLARGEILVFSDANALYEPEALRHLVCHFADPCVAVVSGAKAVIGEHRVFGRAESFYWRYEAWIRSNENLLGQAAGVNGEMLAVRRSEWQPLSPEVINDDFAIALAAMARGRRVIFEPRARSMEVTTAQAADEIRRRERMVAGRWQILGQMHGLIWPPRLIPLWQVLSHKLARALLPLFVTVAACSNLALVAMGERRALTDWLEQSFFAGQIATLFLAGARAWRCRLPPPLARVSSLAAYVLVSQYATIAGLIKWLRGRQGPAWQKSERLSISELETARLGSGTQ